MCKDKNSNWYEKNLPPPSTPVTIFLVAKNLLILWFWDFQTFKKIFKHFLTPARPKWSTILPQ